MNAPVKITATEAPPKTWSDYVAEVEAHCADVPESRSPWRPCRADLIRTMLQQGCACEPDMRRARDEAFAARLAHHPDFGAAVERAVAKAVA
ncbi:MAG: hypothetical protein ACKVOB_13315 [Sphingomonas sp.]